MASNPLPEVPSLGCINLHVSTHAVPEEHEQQSPRHHVSVRPPDSTALRVTKYPSEPVNHPIHKDHPSTGSLAARLFEDCDYEDVTPSEIYEEAKYLPDLSVHIARVRNLRLKPSGGVGPVLELWAEATSMSMLQGTSSNIVPSIVWADLAEATTSIAPKLTVADIIELFKVWATALHRCGPRLDPPAATLAAVADGARASFQSRQHTTKELNDFQTAVGDVLRVVALGGGAGNRSDRRREWGEGLATKLLPIIAVGIAVVHAAYKSAAQELLNGKATPNQIAHSAVFFAQALAPIAYCPRFVTPVLDTVSSNQHDGSVVGCFTCLGPACGTVAPAPMSGTTTSQSMPSYGHLLAKVHSRGFSIAEWLNTGLAPAALNVMNLRALDKFMSALVAAAGDEGTSPEKCPARGALVRCAARALREAARRVRCAQTGQQTICVRSARRLAATARKSWEVAAGAEKLVAREVASCTAVLEKYVAIKEEEEEEATMAEIQLASQQL